MRKGDFQGLENLHSLSLRDNQITNLESGVFQGLHNLQGLEVSLNPISSLEGGVFQGLGNLRYLYLERNEITEIRDGAFKGLNNLVALYLTNNAFTSLNLTHANLDSLGLLEIDQFEVSALILNDAVLSQESFRSILRDTPLIRNVSLVGLAFSDGNPHDLSNLLSMSRLEKVTVDPTLFSLYSTEFNAFDSLFGKTVIVVPEPSALLLCIAASAFALAFHCQRRNATRSTQD